MTTPTISSVTGTLSNGSTLTITGANMVNQSTVGWASGFTTTNTGFEGTTPSADGWNPDAAHVTYTSDGSIVLAGTKSLDCLLQGAFTYSGGTGYGTSYVWKDIAAQGSNNFYARCYTAYDVSTSGNGNWPDSDLKFWWLPGTGSTIFVQPVTAGRNSAPSSWWAYLDPYNQTAANPSGQMQERRWYCVEFGITSAGVFTLWIDNTQILTGSVSTRVASGYMSLGQVTAWNTVAGFGMHQFIEAAVWGTQRLYPLSVIEIANGPTYATATKRYQQPIKLADGSQQIKVDLTGLGAGSYYIFVTNNLRETSAAYALSGLGAIAPVADFSGAPLIGQAPLLVSFADLSSNTPTAWVWDFGANASPATATTQNPSAIYAYGGPKTVSLTASNSGGQNTATKTAYVAARYLKPTNLSASGGALQTIFLQEGFEDTSFASRGWYDNTGMVLVTDSPNGVGTKAAQFRWTVGLTGNPLSGGAMRRKFTESDTLYVRYYIKHSTNWVGSGTTYHPHQFMIATNLTGDYDGFAWTNLTVYIEENQQKLRFAFQDGKNINATYFSAGEATPAPTESRSVAGGNGSYSDGHTGMSAWLDTGDYYNDKNWLNSTVDFSNSAGANYKGDWHLMEFYIAMNSILGGVGQQDGIVRYWMDGILKMEYTNLVIRTGARATQKFNQFALAPYMGVASPADQYYLVDQLVVADMR